MSLIQVTGAALKSAEVGRKGRVKPRPRRRPCDRRSSPPPCFSFFRASASAQQAPSAAVRGIIVRVAPDRDSLEVKTRAGDEKTLRLPADAKVARVVAASLADVKPGVYVGVAAVPGEGGGLKALEVHIFPELLRGVGEGFRPFDLAPGSTMTNGDVNARVEQVDGPQDRRRL